jgi:hypothetical protein
VVPDDAPDHARGERPDVGEAMPRILMPTFRRLFCSIARCGLYEAEDVLAAIDGVDFVELEAGGLFRLADPAVASLAFRSPWKGVARVNPGLRTVRVTRRYDLFVVLCQNVWDLLYLNAIRDWKSHCRASVCWIDEVWAWDVRAIRAVLPLLQRFDHVAVNLRGSVDAVSEALGRACHYVSAGVDVLRFIPQPAPPARCVDVYSIGRRDEATHARLLELCRQRGLFYLYDVYGGNAGSLEVVSHVQQRDMLATVAKRSRYFVVDVARTGRQHETGGQSEPGRRYFEGAAAGAIMIGRLPDSPATAQLLDWPDAVVELGPSGVHVREAIDALESDPARQQAISARNVAEAAIRHDWSYRWAQVLALAELAPALALERRRQRLHDVAARARRGVELAL